ncbi:MAG TPA: pyridoxamine 5'-phosphate oxidase family protein, partial [Pedococcus sp.]
VALFPPPRGARQVYDVHLDLVQTSCGYGISLMELSEQRDLMDRWRRRRATPGSRRTTARRNRVSIDGCPTGLRG